MDIGSRPVTAGDRGLLFDLFVGSRPDFVAAAAILPPVQADDMLRLQFTAQGREYRERFPDSDHRIVTVGGAAAGRVWVDRGADEVRLLDLAILPAHRRRGIGSLVVRGLQDVAAHDGRPLRHAVAKTSDACLRFYGRLGFGVVDELRGTHVVMEWSRRPRSGPGGPAAAGPRRRG